MYLLTLLRAMLCYATLRKYITRYLWGILLLYFTSSKDLFSNKECTAPLELLRISRPHVPRKSPAGFRIRRKKRDEKENLFWLAYSWVTYLISNISYYFSWLSIHISKLFLFNSEFICWDSFLAT